MTHLNETQGTVLIEVKYYVYTLNTVLKSLLMIKKHGICHFYIHRKNSSRQVLYINSDRFQSI